jgi:iron complex outermembrane receptor protein
MRIHLLILAIWLSGHALQAQNTFRVIIKDADHREVLPGASVILDGTQHGTISDNEGLAVLHQVPDGVIRFRFAFLGYKESRQTFLFPRGDDLPVEVFLEANSEEIEEIFVTSTRSTRTIESLPTRVEFISGEELEEKGNMRPGDIRMLLNESTGIQTQQTSPLSANASIRIQGLDGRYTQILKDGFPIYSGAAGGLGLLQIPPLDLRQVEIIKGASSTLYGGGAIAGLVNLISKLPNEERELSFHLSGTSAQGLDLSGFYSERFDHVGLSLFAARNSNAAYDPADAHFSAIPQYERYTLNPRLFLYFNKRTTLNLGLNATVEKRLGGDMDDLDGKQDSEPRYFEDNGTQRLSSQLSLEHRLSEHAKWTFRNSYHYFHRTTTIPDYSFDGRQDGSFSEINYLHSGDAVEWIGGGNLWTERFTEKPEAGMLARDYSQTTAGLFVQNTSRLSSHISMESGLRGDYVAGYGFSLLPRFSALFTLSPKWTSRIGGGAGYKTPTLFSEESERIHYRNVRPIDPELNRLERSYGANADIHCRTAIGDRIALSVNQLFFYTNLRRPLMLQLDDGGQYRFHNIDGHMDTQGAETNLKISCADFTLFVGYTFTDATVDADGVRYQNPLTSKHRLNNVLMYELEDRWKIGLEAYYYSPQKLNDGTSGESYWICGAMVEKIWEPFSVYANFENFTDTRQTRFGAIYTGSVERPVFNDVYAPLDGFIASIGLKIKW